MAQGSGPADRDCGGYFEPIRATFLDRGVATYAFDKPGCGESTGDWRHDGLEDRVDQVIAALELVRNHRSVAADRVGLWGQSQGGWLVQKVAGRRVELGFAIANSAPTIPVSEQVLYDCEQSMRGRGFGEGDLQAALDLARELYDHAAQGSDHRSISIQVLDRARRQPWYDAFPTIEDSDDWEHLKLLLREPHDPLSDLEGIACPFLAVYGGLDVLLPPWRGAEESGRALAASESGDVTVVVFPVGDHRIQDPRTERFVTGYLDLLGAWTGDRAHR